MSDLAIRVENLSKQYTIAHANGRHDTLRDAIADVGMRIVNVFRKSRFPQSAFRNPKCPMPDPQHLTPDIR